MLLLDRATRVCSQEGRVNEVLWHHRYEFRHQ